MRVCNIFLLMVVLAGPTRAKKSKKKKNQDMKYVQCDVCKTAVGKVFDAALGLSGEEAIIDHIDHACEPTDEPGHWLRKLDIRRVRDRIGDRLILKEQEMMGKCNKECRTAVRACSKYLDDISSELTDAIYAGEPDSKEELAKLACNEWTKACSHTSIVPKGFERNDELFEELTAQELREEEERAKAKKRGGKRKEEVKPNRKTQKGNLSPEMRKHLGL